MNRFSVVLGAAAAVRNCGNENGFCDQGRGVLLIQAPVVASEAFVHENSASIIEREGVEDPSPWYALLLFICMPLFFLTLSVRPVHLIYSGTPPTGTHHVEFTSKGKKNLLLRRFPKRVVQLQRYDNFPPFLRDIEANIAPVNTPP
jgi:hypothetical protein